MMSCECWLSSSECRMTEDRLALQSRRADVAAFMMMSAYNAHSATYQAMEVDLG